MTANAVAADPFSDDWYERHPMPDTMKALVEQTCDEAVSICHQKLIGKNQAAVRAYLGTSDRNHGEDEYSYHLVRHNGSIWLLQVEFGGGLAVEVFGQEIGDLSFKVHGRLSIYNGTPACRIWVVGSKRMLGIAQTPPPESPAMPLHLDELLTPDTEVFGDFTVVAMVPKMDGHMQIVRVFAAEKLVQTDLNGQFLKRIPGKVQLE